MAKKEKYMWVYSQPPGSLEYMYLSGRLRQMRTSALPWPLPTPSPPLISCVTLISVQFSCLVVSDSCDLMDCSTPGLPVHHQLPEFIQTHVHSVGDAIQPSHPLSSSSPSTFNLSQHQGLFE